MTGIRGQTARARQVLARSQQQRAGLWTAPARHHSHGTPRSNTGTRTSAGEAVERLRPASTAVGLQNNAAAVDTVCSSSKSYTITMWPPTAPLGVCSKELTAGVQILYTNFHSSIMRRPKDGNNSCAHQQMWSRQWNIPQPGRGGNPDTLYKPRQHYAE